MTEGVSLEPETEWKNFDNPKTQVDDSEEDPKAEPPDPDQIFTVLISTRSFHKFKFLNSHIAST